MFSFRDRSEKKCSVLERKEKPKEGETLYRNQVETENPMYIRKALVCGGIRTGFHRDEH